jgi:CHAT domain-containing protein
MLVIADPEMPDPKWPGLPGTREEALAIRERFPDAVVRMGKDATKAAWESAPAPAVLHVATHGFFLPDARYRLDEAGAAFRGLVLDESPVVAGPGVDPLARAGLVLASAGGSDKGLLSGLEIAAHDLSKTDLVVLSACETGMGEVEAGQGVYGLRRALVLAGVPSQVISLWKVDDEATRDLMIAFYDGLRRNESPSAALRKAKLSLLSRPQTAHPFYWAAFIASGDPAQSVGPLPQTVRARGCGCRAPGDRSVDGWLLALVSSLALAAWNARRRKS